VSGPAFWSQQPQATLQAWGGVAGKLPDGKGPGVLMDSRLNMSQQCAQVLGWVSGKTCLQKGLLSPGIGSPGRWLSHISGCVQKTFGCGAQGHDLAESC